MRRTGAAQILSVLRHAEVVIQHNDIGAAFGKLCHQLCDMRAEFCVQRAVGMGTHLSLNIHDRCKGGGVAACLYMIQHEAVTDGVCPNAHLKALGFKKLYVFDQRGRDRLQNRAVAKENARGACLSAELYVFVTVLLVYSGGHDRYG